VKKVRGITTPSTNFRDQARKEEVAAGQAAHKDFLDAAAKREQFLAELSAALKNVGVDLRGLLDAHTKAILSSPASRQ
jgi:hypothetical protein